MPISLEFASSPSPQFILVWRSYDFPLKISQTHTAAKEGVQTRGGPQDIPPQPQYARAFDELLSTHIRHRRHHHLRGGEEKRREQSRTKRKEYVV